MADGYDPKKSKVSNETMEQWRVSNVSGNLLDVPGIGPAAVQRFLSDPDPNTRITNTHQLIGQYLMLKGPDDEDRTCSVRELNQKFWYYLKAKDIKTHRSAIVLAIYLKVSAFFPNLADVNEEDYIDDDE